ncbi:MAG: dihydrofolate reductase family protein [Nitrospirota bacterium]|nr:dihydrofolate reductase family protein [Nitrospirota bacterium]
MRSLILYIATSLDGYIARADGSIDWLFSDQDYGYREFFAGVDTVVMGRKTYEQSLTFGGYPYPGREGYVFSRQHAGRRDEHVAFIAESPDTFVSRLRQRQGKNIWLVGGAELVRAFMQENLIDAYVISVHPVVLGGGIPLFRPPLPTSWLTLVDSTTFDSGLVQVTYVRKR